MVITDHSILISESLTLTERINKQNSFLDDFELLKPIVLPSEPAFYLYRNDNEDTWLLIQYVPETAKVRDKMLYAASKAALTKELGEAKFVDYFFASNMNEVSRNGYLKHREHSDSDAPMTESEKQLEMIKKEVAAASDVNSNSKRSHVSGLTFPLTEEALDAVDMFATGAINVLVLSIQNSESIALVGKDKLNDDEGLKNLIPLNEPCFLLYQVGNEGVFAYVCPPKAPVKLKMLYSSSKAALIAHLENKSVQIMAKFEVDDAEELIEDLKARKTNSNPQPTTRFVRPARPGRK